MAEMGGMEMPLPDNTLPMMTGFGPFGALEMGGMFSVVKVREGLARGDYKDPGWYQNPPGSVAYRVEGGAASAPQSATAAPQANPARGGKRPAAMEVRARRSTLGLQAVPSDQHASGATPASSPTTGSMPGTPTQDDMNTMPTDRR